MHEDPRSAASRALLVSLWKQRTLETQKHFEEDLNKDVPESSKLTINLREDDIELTCVE